MSAQLIREPADVYHAASSRYLSSHSLARFRACPLLYHLHATGVLSDEDRPAYLVGRALHTHVLEGRDTFRDQYAIGGPINPKTGAPYGTATKAFAEWARAQRKPVLSVEQAILVDDMAASVRSHTVAAALLAEGVAEGVARTVYAGVECQARFDWVCKHVIVDLKTCDDLSWFEQDARRYGYVHQLAFYRAVYAQYTKDPRLEEAKMCYLIAVEKKQPYRCGVWEVLPTLLTSAATENRHAIKDLIRCRENNEWPTRYETLRTLAF